MVPLQQLFSRSSFVPRRDVAELCSRVNCSQSAQLHRIYEVHRRQQAVDTMMPHLLACVCPAGHCARVLPSRSSPCSSRTLDPDLDQRPLELAAVPSPAAQLPSHTQGTLLEAGTWLAQGLAGRLWRTADGSAVERCVVCGDTCTTRAKACCDAEHMAGGAPSIAGAGLGRRCGTQDMVWFGSGIVLFARVRHSIAGVVGVR